MRIGLETVFDPGWPAGLLYVRNLIYTLSSLPSSERPGVILLPLNRDSEARASDLSSYPFVTIAATSPTSGPLAEIAYLRRRALRRFVQPRLRVKLERAFRDLDVTYPGWGTPLPGVPQMRWIPDLQHVHLPHLFTAQETEKRRRRFDAMASSEGVIVFSSYAARDDFLDLHPQPRADLHVWTFCSSVTEVETGGQDPRGVYGLPEFYLYVANQFWAHKEHLTLFQALAALRASGVTPTVVCTGLMEDPRDPGYVSRLLDYIEKNGLASQTTLLGMIDRRDQLAVMRHAAAVIQPSRFEGWSTVIEDAKALGRPVIASDIPVHLEQVPSATFFRVGSPDSLAEALATALPHLVPGPDRQAEQEAAEENMRRRIELGGAFVEIARKAIEAYRP